MVMRYNQLMVQKNLSIWQMLHFLKAILHKHDLDQFPLYDQHQLFKKMFLLYFVQWIKQ